jgi:hypothetical protein
MEIAPDATNLLSNYLTKWRGPDLIAVGGAAVSPMCNKRLFVGQAAFV